MLGQRINELRTSFGWSQVDLARHLGVAKQTVSNWENDNIQPSIEMLIRIAKQFNVTTDYLLGLDSVPRISTEDLPIDFVAHLVLLIEDYKKKESNEPK